MRKGCCWGGPDNRTLAGNFSREMIEGPRQLACHLERHLAPRAHCRQEGPRAEGCLAHCAYLLCPLRTKLCKDR